MKDGAVGGWLVGDEPTTGEKGDVVGLVGFDEVVRAVHLDDQEVVVRKVVEDRRDDKLVCAGDRLVDGNVFQQPLGGLSIAGGEDGDRERLGDIL